MSSWRTRSLALTLAALFLLVATLAIVAQSRAAHHRRTASAVLGDYAAFAAEEYVRRAQQALASEVNPALVALAQAAREGRLPRPGEVESQASERARRLLAGSEGRFVLRLSEAAVDLFPASLSHATEALVDTVRRHSRSAYRRDWYQAFVWLPDSTRVLAYTLRTDAGRGDTLLVGLVLRRDTLRALLAGAARRQPLLPRTLTGGRTADSGVVVAVVDAEGRHLVAGAPGVPGDFHRVHPLDSAFGGLTAEVTLRAAVAPTLIIGGVPPSPLPVVLGVLAVTGLLTALAWWLLRREQDLATQRGDFVAAASHELRTPLAQIRMFAETLALGRVRTEEERQRSMVIIGQEARRLSHLVDNLLHVARAERGALHVAREPVRLGPVLDDVVAAFRPLASSRGVQVQVTVPTGITVMGDAAALAQVFLNLLDNALKYGPSGGRIGVVVESTSSTVRIVVDDQGPGIPLEERRRIWSRFYRLARDRDSASGGSGIGLAIVRDLVQHMGGQVDVADAPDGGARFLVELHAA